MCQLAVLVKQSDSPRHDTTENVSRTTKEKTFVGHSNYETKQGNNTEWANTADLAISTYQYNQLCMNVGEH